MNIPPEARGVHIKCALCKRTWERVPMPVKGCFYCDRGTEHFHARCPNCSPKFWSAAVLIEVSQARPEELPS
jgi:hypothetical protein